MRLESKVIAAVLLAMAGTALFVLWLETDGLLHETIVQGLAGPQPGSAPPAKSFAVAPVSAPAPAPSAQR